MFDQRVVIYFTLIFSLPVLCSHAQDNFKVDSLEALLLQKDTLTLRERALVNIDLAFYHNEPELGLHYAKQAYSLAQVVNDNRLIGVAYEMIGLNSRLLGNFDHAVEHFMLSIKKYNELGLILKQAEVFKQLGDVYSEMRRYDDAVELYRLALPILEKYDSPNFILCVLNLGETFRKHIELDSANFYLNLTLRLNSFRKDSIVEAYTRGNLGMVYHQQGRLNEAMIELDTAIVILNEFSDYYALVTYEAEIGQIEIKQGRNIQQGISRIKTALDTAQRYGLKEQVRDISKQLTELYAEQGDYEKAYGYQQVFQVYQDSIINADNIRKIEQTRAQYEIDQKENERLQAEQQRNYVFIIGGLAVVLALIILWAYIQKQRTNRTLVQKNEIISQQAHEKELLHREMHHRVKNNLQLISSIMGLQARSEKDEAVNHALSSGRSRMEAMTLIHQSLYQEGHEAHVQLKEYLKRLIGYLESSYRDELSEVRLEVAPLILKADDSIPIGLIVNEAICNAVKYRQGKTLTLSVRFIPFENDYQLTIADNGPGFDTNLEDHLPKDIEDAAKAGFGTQLIRTLARQMRASVSIQSSEEGTLVTLVFPKLKVAASDDRIINV